MNYSTIAQWCRKPLPQFLKFQSIEKSSDQYRITFAKTPLFLQLNLCGNDGFCFFSQDDILEFAPTFSGIINLFKNAALLEIKTPTCDRIVEFSFEKKSIYGELLHLKIVVELIPGKQNIIFLEGDKIVLAKKIFTFADNPQRQILPGQKYTLPSNQNTQNYCFHPLPWHDGDYSFDSVNAYLEHFFYNHIHLKRVVIFKKKQQKQQEKEITKAEKKLTALKRVLGDYSKMEYWKMAGELLKSAHHKISPGMGEISLTNYFDAALPNIKIELKKELSPSQNIAYYFKKYKKALSGKKIVENRIKIKEAEINSLKNKPLDENKSKIFLPKKAKTNEKKSFKQIKIDDDLKIVIGRNDAENNTITCSVAGKNDLWFHTRAIKGSHIVILNPYKKNVPQKILEIAASLAAYYSKAKHSGKVAVDYTAIRYVWKIRKGRLGQVNYKNQKTVFVNPKSMREVKKELEKLSQRD